MIRDPNKYNNKKNNPSSMHSFFDVDQLFPIEVNFLHTKIVVIYYWCLHWQLNYYLLLLLLLLLVDSWVCIRRILENKHDHCPWSYFFSVLTFLCVVHYDHKDLWNIIFFWRIMMDPRTFVVWTLVVTISNLLVNIIMVKVAVLLIGCVWSFLCFLINTLIIIIDVQVEQCQYWRN